MSAQVALFDDSATEKRTRTYSAILTADVNDKGVLDVDTVKGCTAGMRARPGTGCYSTCYAAKIAHFRGFDFATSVTRYVQSASHRAAIEKAVAASPYGFFRIGTMGDPCHAWEHTVTVIEWLAEFARPVVITKHWMRATDEQFRRMITCRTVLNTSVSALDTRAELSHRLREIERYKAMGGSSVARIVSCDFNRDNETGAAMDAIQRSLFALSPRVDNPLRAAKNHPLVVAGVIRLTHRQDLGSVRTISIANNETHTGHCAGCTDLCGIGANQPAGTGIAPRQLGLL